jgi:hypothetical protein
MTMNTMPTEYKEVIRAYRQGATADFLQARIRGQWGPLWTVPSCSPTALERAGRQFTRSRAEAVRIYRRARLRSRGGLVRDVAILTTLPERIQHVRDLAGGVVVVNYLTDDVLVALETAMGMPPRGAGQ